MTETDLIMRKKAFSTTALVNAWIQLDDRIKEVKKELELSSLTLKLNELKQEKKNNQVLLISTEKEVIKYLLSTNYKEVVNDNGDKIKVVKKWSWTLMKKCEDWVFRDFTTDDVTDCYKTIKTTVKETVNKAKLKKDFKAWLVFLPWEIVQKYNLLYSKE